MKPTFAGLLLGTLLHVFPAAHAVTTIDAAGFSLAYSGGNAVEPFDMSLISDAGGTARIALGSAPQHYAAEGAASESTFLSGTVRDGYRITSMTLTATVSGVLEVVPGIDDPWYWTTQVGYARNSGSVQWKLVGEGATIAEASMTLRYVEEARDIVQIMTMPVEGDFWMELTAATTAASQPTHQEVHGSDWIGYLGFPAFASVAMEDMYLTVQVVAVPEPATYGMLLGGLGLLAVAARRRVSRSVANR